jgi:hypothetical protein
MVLFKLLLQGYLIDDHKEAIEIQKIQIHKTQSYDVRAQF